MALCPTNHTLTQGSSLCSPTLGYQKRKAMGFVSLTKNALFVPLSLLKEKFPRYGFRYFVSYVVEEESEPHGGSVLYRAGLASEASYLAYKCMRMSNAIGVAFSLNMNVFVFCVQNFSR